jgi:predicted RND superfamily exporter protein
LISGTVLHRQHGRKVIASSLTRLLAVILLLVALALLVAFCTARFI